MHASRTLTVLWELATNYVLRALTIQGISNIFYNQNFKILTNFIQYFDFNQWLRILSLFHNSSIKILKPCIFNDHSSRYPWIFFLLKFQTMNLNQISPQSIFNLITTSEFNLLRMLISKQHIQLSSILQLNTTLYTHTYETTHIHSKSLRIQNKQTIIILVAIQIRMAKPTLQRPLSRPPSPAPPVPLHSLILHAFTRRFKWFWIYFAYRERT